MDRMAMDDMLTFVAIVTGMGCLTGILITWIKYRKKPQQLSSPETINRLEDIAERLARLDGAVDTVAVEVERISEAQRFTAKVLAERAVAPVLPERPRAAGSTTPH